MTSQGRTFGGRSRAIFLSAAASVVLLVSSAWAQDTNGSATMAAGAKLATPTAFPPPGVYPTTESVTLLATDSEARIHYTLDGSDPSGSSPVADPHQLLFLAGLYDGNTGLKAGYTVRAVAMKDGATNSDIATFLYTIDRRDRTAYVSEDVLPGVRMIRDSDNDKMFLIKGSRKAVLVDSGMGRGKLRDYVAQYTQGLPIEVIFTHEHHDHTGQADQFIADCVEHIGEGDRPSVAQSLKGAGVPEATVQANLRIVKDGERIDLGDRSLVVYEASGHTKGSLMVFDEQRGALFTGDSFGSNSPTIPDALWMQGSTNPPIDVYLSSIRNAHAKVRGKVKAVLTGHNDGPLVGEAYLDNLEAAAQALVDKGDAVLVPSFRPPGLSQVVVGDRLTDPNWVAINVNKDHFLSAPPDKIATLSAIDLGGASMHGSFLPDIHAYSAAALPGAATVRITPTTTSTRYKSLLIGGVPLASSAPYTAKLRSTSNNFTIVVTAPDGTVSTSYVLTVNR
jgi:glyoxylase-like metal-dependent hydrolase (beta-lactamase superfamily II)